MMLVLSLSYMSFIMLRYFPSIPNFFRAFIMKGYWIMSKLFFCICLVDHMGLSIILSICLYYIFWFAYIEPSSHPSNETNLIVVHDLLDVLLN
jgi:hypothetical protein